MKKQMKKQLHKGYFVGLGVLLILAMFHYLNTRAGAIESQQMWLVGNYVALVLLVILTVALLGGMLYGMGKLKTCSLEVMFVVASLAFGTLYLWVLPPLSAPDEARHYISAYQLSNRMLGWPSTGEDGKVPMREEDWFGEDPTRDYRPYVMPQGELNTDVDGAANGRILGQTLTQETYWLIHEKGFTNYEEPWAEGGDGTALSNHLPVVTTPFAYLAPALGITIARLLGLNSLCVLFLGRWMNLLLFTGMIYLAMKKLPFGKEVLFGVALLPMTIHLSASYSYDGMILSGVFYFMAYSLFLAYQADRVTPKDVGILALTMAITGPCKMVYTVIMGLCLLIPVKKFKGWGKWALSASCVLGAWAISMILVNSQTIGAYTGETENYISWAGEAGYTMGMLLHQPIRLLQLLYNTIVWQSEHWHLTMIGAYLGNVDLVLDVPYLVVAMLTMCLLGLSVKKPGEPVIFNGGKRLWIWLLCASCVGATMGSMLLAWTPISSDTIAGVQGRYFLPILPIFLMSIKNNLVILTKNADRSILYLMCCANGYVLMRIFSIVCMRI